jgi:PilZ domain
MGIFKKAFDKRNEPRIPYSGHIFFAAKSGFFEGELTNYSKHGLFIRTKEDLTLGEIITVALPYVENKQVKFQAQILWRNNEGYGLELLRKRDDTSLQFRKIEAKSR